MKVIDLDGVAVVASKILYISKIEWWRFRSYEHTPEQPIEGGRFYVQLEGSENVSFQHQVYPPLKDWNEVDIMQKELEEMRDEVIERISEALNN